ncbi:hypothetical protein HPHPA9_0300 [Helicobacter pylori Hp A-9]|uniref:Uncharacterized protein n=1 Tax=Helicobacter pylori Hp A-9 TaxID=992034 RepID=J0K3P8_HELPX|nr:hypothetical protein HPHPA9_0300 [Helicobacter pylori Hp A-9]
MVCKNSLSIDGELIASFSRISKLMLLCVKARVKYFDK